MKTLTEAEVKRLASEALVSFDTEKHYIVKAVYADGLQLVTRKYFADSFESLDYLLDGLIDDDMVDLEVTATSLSMDDFLSLGMKLEVKIY